MRIQNNMIAIEAANIFKNNNRIMGKKTEKLASGFRVNRAADDASALSISEKMRNQIRGLNMATKNIEDGVSYVQVADGALSEIHSILHRIEELAVKSANDTNAPEDREAIDAEVQCLKEEVQKIFVDTEFNGMKVWDEDLENKVQVGVEKAQALKTVQRGTSFYVTDVNKGAIAKNGYKIEVQGTDKSDATNYGFKVTWKGWNNKDYESELINWDDIGAGKKKSVSLNLKDYLDTTNYPETEGIQLNIGWTNQESATVKDIADSIDGITYSSSISSSESITTSDPTTGVSFSVTTNYLAELASDRSANTYDTEWIEAYPAAGSANITKLPTYTDTTEDTSWEIKFNMKNVGPVTAKVTGLSFSSNDTDADDEDHWWHYYTYPSGRQVVITNSFTPKVGSTGSLWAATDTITNSTGAIGSNGKGYSLTDDAENGGSLKFTFKMTPDSGSFNYEGTSSSEVGTITMTVKVYDDDTEETLMRRLESALNSNTVIDIYEGNKSSNSASRIHHSIGSAKERKIEIDVPIYNAKRDMVIQSGANMGDTFHIIYDTLRLRNLGIENTNVLTHEDSQRAIGEVQEAVKIVSAQRSLFGAYTNRMEHALAENENYAENLQRAESQIRDTDMAEEIMEHSKLNILQQATQSMLANANNIAKDILQLIS